MTVQVTTFKKLVEMISNIKTEADRSVVCGSINTSFEHEKISYKDHELLYGLAYMIETR